MAIDDPFHFPACFQAFLYLPQPETIDSVPEMMEKQPELLMMSDSKGHTPLHACCTRGLSVDVVRVLLRDNRYPGAHRAVSVRDNKDRYPLFFGACYQLPFEAVKLIFDINPDSIRHIEEYRLLHPHVAFITPLHTSIELDQLVVRRMVRMVLLDRSEMRRRANPGIADGGLVNSNTRHVTCPRTFIQAERESLVLIPRPS